MKLYTCSSIDDPELSDSIIEEVPVTFTVVNKGSKRGGSLLVSNDWFSCNLKVCYTLFVCFNFDHCIFITFSSVTYSLVLSISQKSNVAINFSECKIHVCNITKY